MLQRKLYVLLLIAAISSGCTTRDASGDANSKPTGAPRPMQDDVTTSTGTRMDVDPSTPRSNRSAASSSDSEKDRRGNTPPGMDRAGQGPASGAIVDPSGATKGGKP